ncbi:hypothetical protein Tco_0015941 [Tanacetum coccineum]
MEEEQNQPEVMQELLLKLMDDLQILKGIQQEKKETATQNFTPYWNFSMIDDEEARENFMKDVCTFLRKTTYQQEDIQELMSKLLEDVRNINEELSEFINSPSWNRPTFYNDDDKYTIIYRKPKEITPDLPIEEPDNSLKEREIDIDIFQIKDEILHEKLLNVNLLIDKIEALNLTPSIPFVLEYPSSSHIPVVDSEFLIEELRRGKTTREFPIIYHPPEATDTEILQARENLMDTIQAFLKEYYRMPPEEKCMALLLAEERFLKLSKQWKKSRINMKKPKAITLDLPIEELNNSLSMGDEHLNTIPEMKKSSVENLVPIPSEFKGISEDICDILSCDNDHFNVECGLINSLLSRDILIASPKIDFLPEEFVGELDFIDPILPGIDEDNIDEDDFDKDDFDEDDFDKEEGEIDIDILQIEDEILREKLLNVNLLIDKIEALNLTPSIPFMLEYPSSSPIPVVDSDFLVEEVDTFLVPKDSIPPGIESDLDLERDIVFLDNLLNDDHDDPIPEYERFTFDIEPDAPVINNFDELNEDECFDPGGGEIDVSQNIEDDDSFAFVIRTFLPYRTYPVDSPLLLSTGSEDTIFDPDIST